MESEEVDNSQTIHPIEAPHFDRRILFWAVFLGMIAIDQLMKAWVRHVFASGNLDVLGGKPWPGIFEITLTYNRGIAFGMLQGHGILLAPVAILMAGFAVYFSYAHRNEPIFMHVALGLLGAGALGNLLDRIIFGKVTDMFYFRPINFPVFNVADTCITVSACLLLYQWTFESAIKATGKPATVTSSSTTADH